MAFVYRQKIRFRHCDPAGIVFYPRYFEMINDTVETFFDIVLGFSFGSMHPQNGIPTAQIQTRFTAPSRLGDELVITMRVVKVGRSSLGVEYAAHCGEEQRFAAASTLVLVDNAGKPTPWVGRVKDVLHAQLEGENDAT